MDVSEATKLQSEYYSKQKQQETSLKQVLYEPCSQVDSSQEVSSEESEDE